MLESVVAICLFAITMLLLVERLFRKNSAQDKEIQAIRREIDELRTNLYCAQIDCIKRDQTQIDMIEKLIRWRNEETEGK
jgi:hypothetical protein